MDTERQIYRRHGDRYVERQIRRETESRQIDKD